MKSTFSCALDMKVSKIKKQNKTKENRQCLSRAEKLCMTPEGICSVNMCTHTTLGPWQIGKALHTRTRFKRDDQAFLMIQV